MLTLLHPLCQLIGILPENRKDVLLITLCLSVYLDRLSMDHRMASILDYVLNVCSLTNKGSLISELVTDLGFDFLCLTETWQQPRDFAELNLLGLSMPVKLVLQVVELVLLFSIIGNIRSTCFLTLYANLLNQFLWMFMDVYLLS